MELIDLFRKKQKEYVQKYPYTKEEQKEISQRGTQRISKVMNLPIKYAQKLPRRIIKYHPEYSSIQRKSEIARLELEGGPNKRIKKLQKVQQKFEIEKAKQKQAILQRATRLIYPNIPSQAVPSQRRGRGRPVGSVKYPGGVYKWRKLMRAQKAVARYETLLRQSRAMQYYPQMVAGQVPLPQQVPVPQEMQAQVQVPMETQQYPQYQQQMYQPQIMPEPQKRAIVPVFKQGEGKPYPPVSSQPLQPSNQTIPQGYVEATDLMTGRRYMKPLPRKEAWIS